MAIYNPKKKTAAGLEQVQIPSECVAGLGKRIIILTDNGSTTAGTWTAVSNEVTALHDGDLFLYKVTVAGASTTKLQINSLGAKRVYSYGTTDVTTKYAVGCYLILSYNSTNDCFRCINNYDSTNVYQLRNNSAVWKTKTVTYRYKIMLQCSPTELMEVSNNTGATDTAGHTIDTTTKFYPFGPIFYLNKSGGSTTDYYKLYDANVNISTSALYSHITLDLRYSFNTAQTLTNGKDVYLVANPTSDGYATLNSNPITQTLPTTADGKIYIYLGHTYSTYQIELSQEHPIYYFTDGHISLYTGMFLSDYYTKTTIDDLLNEKQDTIECIDTAAELNAKATVANLGNLYIYTGNESAFESKCLYRIGEAVSSEVFINGNTYTGQTVQFDTTLDPTSELAAFPGSMAEIYVRPAYDDPDYNHYFYLEIINTTGNVEYSEYFGENNVVIMEVSQEPVALYSTHPFNYYGYYHSEVYGWNFDALQTSYTAKGQCSYDYDSAETKAVIDRIIHLAGSSTIMPIQTSTLTKVTKTSELINDSGYIKPADNTTFTGSIAFAKQQTDGSFDCMEFAGSPWDFMKAYNDSDPDKNIALSRGYLWVQGNDVQYTLYQHDSLRYINDNTEKDTTLKYPEIGGTHTLAITEDIHNPTIVINQGGTERGRFTLNQSGNTTINLASGGGSGGEPNDYVKFARVSGNQISFTANTEVVTNYTAVQTVGAGTGLSISGTATNNPTVNIASGYKLPTTSEWNSKFNVSGGTFTGAIAAPGITSTNGISCAGGITATGAISTSDTIRALNGAFSIGDSTNVGMEMGWTNLSVGSRTPYFDFHTGGNNDYDVRFLISGGQEGASGKGVMNIYAGGGLTVSGPFTAPSVTSTSGNLVLNGTTLTKANLDKLIALLNQIDGTPSSSGITFKAQINAPTFNGTN